MDAELYDNFVSCYNNTTLTGHDVRRINNLNSKEYSNIRKLAIRNGDIPPVRHMNRTGAKFYSKTPRGTFTVQKQYGHDKLFVGEFPDEETAQMIRDKCLEVEWELNRIRDVIDEHKVKPKNYTCINGYYVVQKCIDGVSRVYCAIRQDRVSEDTVRDIVDKFRDCDWDLSCKENIMEEFNIK